MSVLGSAADVELCMYKEFVFPRVFILPLSWIDFRLVEEPGQQMSGWDMHVAQVMVQSRRAGTAGGWQPRRWLLQGSTRCCSRSLASMLSVPR